MKTSASIPSKIWRTNPRPTPLPISAAESNEQLCGLVKIRVLRRHRATRLAAFAGETLQSSFLGRTASGGACRIDRAISFRNIWQVGQACCARASSPSAQTGRATRRTAGGGSFSDLQRMLETLAHGGLSCAADGQLQHLRCLRKIVAWRRWGACCASDLRRFGQRPSGRSLISLLGVRVGFCC